MMSKLRYLQSFNSILVRLKVLYLLDKLNYVQLGFNSILVRLKDEANAFYAKSKALEFQFHTGSIKRNAPAREPEDDADRVSIPYWFD